MLYSAFTIENWQRDVIWIFIDVHTCEFTLAWNALADSQPFVVPEAFTEKIRADFVTESADGEAVRAKSKQAGYLFDYVDKICRWAKIQQGLDEPRTELQKLKKRQSDSHTKLTSLKKKNDDLKVRVWSSKQNAILIGCFSFSKASPPQHFVCERGTWSRIKSLPWKQTLWPPPRRKIKRCRTQKIPTSAWKLQRAWSQTWNLKSDDGLLQSRTMIKWKSGSTEMLCSLQRSCLMLGHSLGIYYSCALTFSCPLISFSVLRCALCLIFSMFF